jgi:2-polyprenyl-3-methyl-5-hydroxy-6-metoxy-1,4-benzoquinol methylase
MHSDTTSDLNNDFLKEYTSKESIRRYTKKTAGYGIGYLVDHDYGRIYLETIERHISQSQRQKGIRLWEFGCGGGMNLVHLISLMERRGIALDCAYGTDFSETLIEAARCDATNYLTLEQRKKVHFSVAKNENLIEDVTEEAEINKNNLLGSFDVIWASTPFVTAIG